MSNTSLLCFLSSNFSAAVRTLQLSIPRRHELSFDPLECSKNGVPLLPNQAAC